MRGHDHGPLVTSPDHERLVIALEPASLGAGGTLGAFGRSCPHVLVSSDATPGAALAAAFVVSGTQTCPCREAAGGGEGVQIAPGCGDRIFTRSYGPGQKMPG